MTFLRPLTAAFAMLFIAAPLVASAASFRADFEVEITNLTTLGDVNNIGDPAAGLSVGDALSGSLFFDAPQDDQNDGENDGFYDLSGYVLNLLSGDAGFLPFSGPGFDGFEFIPPGNDFIIVQTDPILSIGAVDIFREEDFDVGRIQFLEEIEINNSGDLPGFADVTVLNPQEIAANLIDANFSYSLARKIGVEGGRGSLTAVSTDQVIIQGIITDASVSAVPLPAPFLLLLAGVSVLGLVRRVAR